MYGPVWKGALDLNLVDSGRDAGKNMSTSQQGLAVVRQQWNGMPTITDAFLKLRSDKGDGFVDVELQSPREAVLSKGACLLSKQLDVFSELLLDKLKVPDGVRVCRAPSVKYTSCVG